MLNVPALLAVSLVLMSDVGPGAAKHEPEPNGEQKAAHRNEPIGLGETMPNFVLPDADGKEVTLQDQLAKGPVVVTFYRGTWCPFCRKALGSIEESVGDINKQGATVWAVSPQTAEHAVDLREQLGLSYELLVDHDNTLADRLGLMFTLDPATVEKYKGYGIDLPESNGTDTWQLPIPATYVIDRHGKIRYAWTEKDYTKRAPVRDVLAALQEIKEEG